MTRAIIIAVGDELTSGQLIETNSAHLARELGKLGIETAAYVTVGDSAESIAAAISLAAGRADLLLMTGGLGPTADDVTREALASAMGCELRFDEASFRQIEEFFRSRGRKMATSNRSQAMIPAGAKPLANRLGTAPGIAGRLGECQVFAMPGVPHEMKDMFAQAVAPLIRGTGEVILHRVVHSFGAGESDVDQRLGELAGVPANVCIGTTVSAGVVSVRVTSKAGHLRQAEKQVERTVELIRSQLGSLVFGTDDDTMASVVGELLRRRGQTLATAESCTGGLVGQMITSVPGSSDYYVGGIIAYADSVKQEALAVPQALLAQHGAVSAEVASAMAQGCLEKFQSNWAVSITGIAGPGGGSAAKPVGLVFTGLASPAAAQVHRHVFPGPRQIVRRRAAVAALNCLRLALL